MLLHESCRTPNWSSDWTPNREATPMEILSFAFRPRGRVQHSTCRRRIPQTISRNTPGVQTNSPAKLQTKTPRNASSERVVSRYAPSVAMCRQGICRRNAASVARSNVAPPFADTLDTLIFRAFGLPFKIGLLRSFKIVLKERVPETVLLQRLPPPSGGMSCFCSFGNRGVYKYCICSYMLYKSGFVKHLLISIQSGILSDSGIMFGESW